MKYFTPEWYERMQKTDLHLLLKPDIRAAVYDEALYQELYQKEYARALKIEYGVHAFSAVDMVMKDSKRWVDAGFISQEEYEEELADAARRDAERKQNPVDPEKVREVLNRRLATMEEYYRRGLPVNIKNQVADIRVLALWTATPEIITLIRKISYGSKKYVDGIFAAQRKRLEEIDSLIPDDVKNYFFSLHDATITKVERNEQSMQIFLEGYYYNYKCAKCITLSGYEIVTMDIGEDVWWLYSEFDVCADGRYEIGILCQQDKSMSQIHMLAKSIVIEVDEYSEEEIQEIEEKLARMEELGLIETVGKPPTNPDDRDVFLGGA